MALLTALMATLMMLALGAGITMTTLTEAAIAANHRDGLQVLYAAEAGIDLAASRLRENEDWAALVNGRGVLLLDGHLADMLGDGRLDPRITVTVTAELDPNSNQDVVLLQSTARIADGVRRSVQATIRR